MSEKTAAFEEPFGRLQEWLAEAEESEPNDPTAVALATATKDGFPSLRMVLMKGCDERGVVFYTNLESRKGVELAENPNVAMLFHWKSLRRQIRIEGAVEPVTTEEADAYFASRPRASRIGAWASKQSREMAGRFEFEAAIAQYTAKFGVGEVPRPENWSGFRLKPKYFEFWRDRKFRLHERITYTLNETGSIWGLAELYP
ncbi:pyridoxamine 5'-phosphate oxidase [Kordiimonas gwangyangensis]|uniref:pyridoxamine 5'-phosphate oxidase n=1 Tax=Kordiimonas gwangyangensis TaxID=288022 RepID=UPI000371C892|nr:pyridoxamine 5'-phosphate oxidase [Kordiimonas gwangyangensis]